MEGRERQLKNRGITEKLKIDDAVYASPHIVLTGNRTASVTGCTGVSEYETDRITLVADGRLISFSGFELEILSLGDGEAVVRGRFSAVEFR